MYTGDFFYDLPKELIAQTPLERRDGSRMLALRRDPFEMRHAMFADLPGFLRPGDCLVFNDSRVIPARLIGRREGGGEAEVFLLRRVRGDEWEALVRPGRRLRTGARVVFGGGELTAVITGEDEGNRTVRFEYDGIWEELLDRLGRMPLPPYITEELGDSARYQTVYAAHDGSAAAPTAGLHFTEGTLRAVRAAGAETAFVTLHVGLGTFRPVKAENIEEHKMHSEHFILSEEAAEKINAARAARGRVVAVGTTACRVLESASDESGRLTAAAGETDIFIRPGYKFKCVDALLTNFHLPASTLLMLVSAFAGRENVLEAYRRAVEARYRFFSFGDCMFLY